MYRCVKCGELLAKDDRPAESAGDSGQEAGAPPESDADEAPITRGTSRTRGGESDLQWCAKCGEWVEAGEGGDPPESGGESDDDRITRGTSRTRG